MVKNKKAIQLSLYFTASLLAFSIIIGSIFIALYRSHSIRIHKNQLSIRTESISKTVSDHLGNQTCAMCGENICDTYYRFLGDIAGTAIWIVDEDRNFITSGMRNESNNSSDDYSYYDLPENAECLIDDVFDDKTVFSESFSGILSESTLTVGSPIKDKDGKVIGAVLLHSPINGVNEAVSEGAWLLVISMCIALILAIVLSVWLSKTFTDPIVSKEAEDALRLDSIRREFVANISHELKTPITVIRGSLEALVDKVVTDPVQIEDYHSQMLRETTFLQRLVGDLLDLSKLQNTDFIIERQNIYICDILDDVIRSIGHTASIKGVTITLEKDNPELMIYVDYGRIRQMLMIILDNAVKFSLDNSTVEIMLKGKTLYIRDYGIGIPKDEIPLIFDRFYKSHSEHNKIGVGLGLAIAKQIADRHGIDLSVHSNIDEGSTFIVRL